MGGNEDDAGGDAKVSLVALVKDPKGVAVADLIVGRFGVDDGLNGLAGF